MWSFILVQLVALTLTFVAIALIIHMDGSNAQKMMICFMIGVLVQNAGNLFEALSSGPAEALVAIKLQYLGACFVPLFFSQFIFMYCNQRQPQWLFRSLGYIDLIVLILVWTCNYHHMFYKNMTYVFEGTHPHFVFSYGWGFWLFIWIGALTPFGLAVWALIRSFMEDNYQRRKKHYILFIILAVIPAGALLMRASQQMKDYDLVPPTLAIVLSSVVIFVWSRRNYDLSRAAAETVMHESENGVIFLDDEERIVGYNPAVEEIFYDLDKRLIGKKVTKIRNFPEEIMQDDQKREFTMGDRYFEGHIEPVNDKKGILLGYVILIFDVTQRKRLMMESIEMREKAEAASKIKSEFMAAMSHEMRTPMNAIVGFADLIKEESLGRKVYQYACDIKEASARLLKIFNDIWDISSVEAGQVELVKEDYRTRKLLQSVADKASVAAEAKGLTFDLITSDSLPAGLHGDQERIRQVLDNVLDNAVKFTQKGRVTMVVDGDYIADGHIMLKFLIRDTGIGIEEKYLTKIFYNFEQVDSSESRHEEGTGLGLSVAKNIVELMGGSMSVESVLGKGSTFAVIIPQTVSDARTLSEVSTDESEILKDISMFSAPDAKILVVDDNLINRKIARGVLRVYGCQVDEAENGFEAIRLVKEKKYEIIFMDHMMPEMDGVTTTKRIRKECGENGKQAVVIALTANVMKGVKEMFLNNGFQDFIAKPVDRIPMYHVLSKWIPANKKQETTEPLVMEDVELDEIAEIFIKGIDVKHALTHHTGNLNEYLEILNLFYIDGIRKIEYLDTLLKEEDYENYRIEVHALKSASANIGAKELSGQAERLETAAMEKDITYIAKNHETFLEAYRNLLDEIKKVLDKHRKKEERNHVAVVGEVLTQEVIVDHLQQALYAVEHFKSKECKEKIEWLLSHETEEELHRKLTDIQGRLQLYEDDEAEELLRDLIQNLDGGKG